MNKIIVSILLTVVLVLGINKIAETIFYVKKPEKSAYQVKNLSTNSTNKTASSGSEKAETGDIMALLASVSVDDGKKVFKKCAACHSIAEGGGNKIGPALWGVLGKQAGSLENYKYSKAMASYGKKWSIEEINGFLLKPKEWIKGTKMSFVGLKKEKERAAIILYLNKNSNNPISLQ